MKFSSFGDGAGEKSSGSSDDDSSGNISNRTPITHSEECFVLIPGKEITGNETWVPESKVFVTDRKLEIASFYMCKHEVTKGEFKNVMGALPSSAGDDGNYDGPVGSVDWTDAIMYCNNLSLSEGRYPCYKVNGSHYPSDWGEKPTAENEWANNEEWTKSWETVTCDFTANGYRLPTEAEWEWAARGGQTYTYAGSNNIDDVAVWSGNFHLYYDAVMSKKPNGYGLYDMSGNVAEWCWDWYGEEIVASDTGFEGSLSSYGGRCIRGGGSGDYAYACEVARRNSYSTSMPFQNGFRVVRSTK